MEFRAARRRINLRFHTASRHTAHAGHDAASGGRHVLAARYRLDARRARMIVGASANGLGSPGRVRAILGAMRRCAQNGRVNADIHSRRPMYFRQ